MGRRHGLHGAPVSQAGPCRRTQSGAAVPTFLRSTVVPLGCPNVLGFKRCVVSGLIGPDLRDPYRVVGFVGCTDDVVEAVGQTLSEPMLTVRFAMASRRVDAGPSKSFDLRIFARLGVRTRIAFSANFSAGERPPMGQAPTLAAGCQRCTRFKSDRNIAPCVANRGQTAALGE